MAGNNGSHVATDDASTETSATESTQTEEVGSMTYEKDGVPIAESLISKMEKTNLFAQIEYHRKQVSAELKGVKSKIAQTNWNGALAHLDDLKEKLSKDAPDWNEIILAIENLPAFITNLRGEVLAAEISEEKKKASTKAHEAKKPSTEAPKKEVPKKEIHNPPVLPKDIELPSGVQYGINALKSTEARQIAAAILAAALGFMVYFLMNSAGKTSSVSSGELFSEALFTWIMPICSGLTGLIAGLAVFNKDRDRYVTTGVIMIPFGVVAIPLFFIPNFFAKMCAISVLIFIGMFWATEIVVRGYEKVKGTKIKVSGKTVLKVILWTVAILIVLCGAYFGPQVLAEMSTPTFDKKTVPLCIGTLLVLSSICLWGYHKRNVFIALGGIPLSGLAFGLLYATFYMIDWQNVSTPVIIVGASILVVTTVATILWFAWKSSGKTEEEKTPNAPAEKVKSKMSWKKLKSPITMTLCLAIGFGVAAGLSTFLPAYEKMAGLHDIDLEPGEKPFVQEYPYSGFHVFISVNEGSVFVRYNDRDPEEITPERGVVAYTEGTRKLEVVNPIGAKKVAKGNYHAIYVEE